MSRIVAGYSSDGLSCDVDLLDVLTLHFPCQRFSEASKSDNCIEDHRVETGISVDLAKVDLLSSPHALRKRGLFDNVETAMTMTATADVRPNFNDLEHAKAWKLVEEEHFGQGQWQLVAPGGRMMVELLHVRDTGKFAVVVRTFNGSVKRGSWPEQTGTEIYLPIDDDNRWDRCDQLLTAFRDENVKPD